MKVTNNKLFVLRYKLQKHHFNSKPVYNNHVQQGECLAQSLQILTLGNRSLCAGN